MSTKITVFRGWKDPGKFVWSPYVTKLEARLRFGGVPYTAEAGSPRSAPKGKIPYVEVSPPLRSRSGSSGTEADAETGTEQLADSALIAKALCDAGILPDLNARLSKAERAHDLALRALLEDKLSFYHVSRQPRYHIQHGILFFSPSFPPPFPYVDRQIITNTRTKP